MLKERQNDVVVTEADVLGLKEVRHPYPGLYVVFEGAEGAGKTTQKDLLVEALLTARFAVVGSKEPGGTPLGTKIRDILLKSKEEGMPTPSGLAEVFLFAADRAQLAGELDVPTLQGGGILVKDRSVYSSIAIQGKGRDLGMDFVWKVNQNAVGNVVPDLVVFIDTPPEEGLRRRVLSGKLDRIDKEEIEFHQRVYGGLQDLVRADPKRWFVVPGHLTPGALHGVILQRVGWELAIKGIQPVSASDTSGLVVVQ